MKKIIQIILFYGIGILFMLSVSWRVTSLDNNTSLADNYNQCNEVCNN